MGFKKVKRKDSFGQWYLEKFGEEKLEELLSNEKNEHLRENIFRISTGSDYHIWFKCNEKDYHENCMKANSFYSGGRCKYCGRTKYVHPKDSLGQYIVDNFGEEFLNKVWSNKNTKSAFKYSLGTENKVWFNCIDGLHEPILRQVKNAFRSNFECTECVSVKNESRLSKKTKKYLKDIGYSLNIEHSCSIRPINPKTHYPLPYDIEVKELHLIIEINGRQHYEEVGSTSKWLDGKTTKEYLHNRKLLDRYKRIYAKTNGFFYLEIPYWCDDNEESWKLLINEKIKEINEGTTTEMFQFNL